MTRDKIDTILRVVLSVLLFAVPIALAMAVWCSPELKTVDFLVTLSTFNVVLGVSEVLFLVRAAIFPKDGKKWWRDW